jgi:hypothetical protein
MPTASRARRDIYTLLKAAWDAGAATTGKTLLYDNIDGAPPKTHAGAKKDADVWGACSIRHNISSQNTLRGDQGVRIEKTGILIVRTFVAGGEGLSTSDAVVKIVSDAFIGVRSPNDVVFRAPTPDEQGNDGPWFQVNVTVPFEYDEIKS